jgi:hypothetical protein
MEVPPDPGRRCSGPRRQVEADGRAGRKAATAALAELKAATDAHYAEFQTADAAFEHFTTASFPAALEAYVRTTAMNSTLEAYARRCLTGGPYV